MKDKYSDNYLKTWSMAVYAPQRFAEKLTPWDLSCFGLLAAAAIDFLAASSSFWALEQSRIMAKE